MSGEDGFSTFTKHGTGHILEDLLSCTVLLKRSNFVPPAPSRHDHIFPMKIESENNSSPEELRSCSICSESTNLRPLALQEMEILAKFVLSQEQISLILQTEDHPPIFCCKICSTAILSLAKLTTQIENITISLRAVISSRNGLFNKLRKEESAKISAADSGTSPTEQIPPNGDDPHLTGGVEEEEEFSVKVESTCDDDDDLTPDPLYEPDSSESDDDDSDAAISDISAASKPAVRTKRSAVPRKPKPFPCPTCDQRFRSFGCLYRHKRYVHEKVATFTRKCTHCPNVFTSLNQLQKHLEKRHKVPVPSREACYYCAICAKNFGRGGNKNRHVENAHFPDKTTCPYGCVTKFDSEAAWVTHLEGCDSPKMSAEPACVCRYCPAVFRNLFLQIEHCLRVHPENGYLCSSCGQKFTSQSALNSHRCTKPAARPAKRKVPKPVTEVGAGSKLIRQPKSRKNKKNINPASKKFACKQCRIKFTDKKNLLRHVRNKNIHPDNDATTSDEITRQFVKKIGPAKEKPSAPKLITPRVRYPCDMCSTVFTTRTSLHRHVELVHFPDKTSCPYGCPGKIGSKVEWVTHLEGCDSPKMSAESECVCEFCPDVFRNTLLRMDHELREHSEKCYSCSVCEGIFSRANVRHNHRCKL